jgi:hypothetical protein
VNAGSSPGNISPLFGHNIAWVSEGNRLWDTTNWRVKTGALPLIQQVAAKQPGFTRFPGGNQADTYRWRRGVGPTNTRPYTPVPWDPDGERNTFGTDEFAAFCHEIGSNVEAMMTANWWDSNKPSRFDPNSQDYDPQAPEKGSQETAVLEWRNLAFAFWHDSCI